MSVNKYSDPYIPGFQKEITEFNRAIRAFHSELFDRTVRKMNRLKRKGVTGFDGLS